MPAQWFELLSLTARYLFTFLGVLIVLRAFIWLLRDRSARHRRLRRLPDAGCIGEMEIVSGTQDAGMSVTVPREGELGYLRTCDIALPLPGVAAHHADFRFEDGEGLVIVPRRGCHVAVDGTEIRSEREAEEHPMQHGSVLQLGDAIVRLRVFSGIDLPHAAQVRPFSEDEALTDTAAPVAGLEAMEEQPSSYAPYRQGVPQQSAAVPEGYTYREPVQPVMPVLPPEEDEEPMPLPVSGHSEPLVKPIVPVSASIPQEQPKRRRRRPYGEEE